MRYLCTGGRRKKMWNKNSGYDQNVAKIPTINLPLSHINGALILNDKSATVEILPFSYRLSAKHFG
jgi:hypothetical protein